MRTVLPASTLSGQICDLLQLHHSLRPPLHPALHPSLHARASHLRLLLQPHHLLLQSLLRGLCLTDDVPLLLHLLLKIRLLRQRVGENPCPATRTTRHALQIHPLLL